MKFDSSTPFYVAGHRGMVGSAVVRKLQKTGHKNIIFATSSELDLTNRTAVFDFFKDKRPEIVVVAAAKVGGILANKEKPVDFLSENLQIQTNVLDAALAVRTEKLVFLGSSCIYPKFATQPISEGELLRGPLEQTNEAYAIAKIAGLKQVAAVRNQFGLNWFSLMPANLYGPGDNYHKKNSHVLPALIRRYVEAKNFNSSVVENWGSGRPRREFLYVDDLAEAILFSIENYTGSQHLNVGTGVDYEIREIANLVAEIVGFSGITTWNENYPDGTPQKLLDVSQLNSLGWKPSINFEEGLFRAIEDFKTGANRQ